MTDEYFSLVCDDVPHDVVLTDPGIRVMDVVQVVRRLTGLSLWRSKILATQVPAVVLTCVSEEDAAAAVSALRDAGARAETREQPEPDFLKH
jgi:large subunit ribosomal protein L7/L12